MNNFYIDFEPSFNDKKAKKRTEKAKRKVQKAKIKEERKAQKLYNKNQNSQRILPNGKRGYIIAIVSLSTVVVALLTVLSFNFFGSNINNDLESSYKKSYYEAVSYVDSMEVDLSKIIATKDSEAVQKYLTTLTVNAELAENNLQQLPIEDESKYYTMKLINQVSDYSKYLQSKMIEGESLNSQDIASLKTLYKGTAELKQSLQKINENLTNGYNFSDLLNAEKTDALLSNFNNLQNISVSYPELIYDGPFSDGKTYQNIRGNSQQEISEEDAKNIIIEKLSDYNLQQLTFENTCGNDILAYLFTAKYLDSDVTIEVAKNGGNILLFSVNSFANEQNYSSQKLVENAQKFIEKLGYKNMFAVWHTNSNGIEVINFVCKNNGIIYYPDMVKVNVNSQTGMVVGLESSSYYINHTKRNVVTPTINQDEAQQKVFDELKIESKRLAVIPKGNNLELLTYEFCGSYNGETYYVYISATNGKQVEMFKVIDSTNGKLLI